MGEPGGVGPLPWRLRLTRLRPRLSSLRGNWASGSQLNDLMAQLLIKNGDGSYSTTGDYQVWKYYADMGNAPCQTTEGNLVDSYATAGEGVATALVGSQAYTGPVNVVFNDIDSKFGGATQLQAKLIRLPYNGGGEVTGVTTAQTLTVNVENNSATVTFDADVAEDGWAVELSQ